jgi:hypothetical protein
VLVCFKAEFNHLPEEEEEKRKEKQDKQDV